MFFIDTEAAEVVRRVYRLCIEGKGNETIARMLQEDKVLVPMAYWQSKGLPRGGKKTQADPYKWCKTTIAKMLSQQEYIREDALEQIVLMELRMLADFLESAEEAFAELLEKKTNKDMHRERTAAEGALATARARSQKILGLFEKLYEDNVEGKVTDEWFMRLSQKYENEQEELKRQTLELKEKLDSIDRMQTAKDDFLKAIYKFKQKNIECP